MARHISTWLTFITAATIALAMMACERDTGDQLDDAADRVEDASQEAADAVGDAAEDAADAMDEASDRLNR